jgi:type I restriction enzyme S subunit
VNVLKTRAGNILTLQRRKVPVEPTEMYREIGIRSFGRGIFHKDPVTGSVLGDKKVFFIEPGDLVVSNVFAWEGAVAVATESERGFIGSHRFMTWTPSTDLGVGFARQYLSSEAGLRALQSASPGSAGRNRTLGVQAFKELLMPIPSLDVQTNIARRLEKVEDASLETLARIEESEAVLDALHNQLFRKGFDLQQLSSLLSETTRFEAIEPDLKYRRAGVQWYAKGVFHRDAKPALEIKATKLNRLVAGEFIYNRLFAWKGSFALTTEEQLHASNEFPTFQIDESIVLPEYLLGWFSLPAVWADIERLSTGATPTSRNRLKQKQLLGLSVPLPSLPEQEVVVGLIREIKRARKLNSDRQRIAKAIPQAARNSEFANLLAS